LHHIYNQALMTTYIILVWILPDRLVFFQKCIGFEN
jgi:hypothetical protein